MGAYNSLKVFLDIIEQNLLKKDLLSLNFCF